MEFVIDSFLWGYSLSVLGVEAAVSTVSAHWRQLFWVVGGVILWTVVQPVLSVTVRFWSAVGRFVYKWAELTKICFRRYQRFTHGAKFRARARGDRWWTLYEALWTTPMVVLEARQEHLYGLGRLIHKWLDAFHAYWCVFLPDTIEASGQVVAKYWNG